MSTKKKKVPDFIEGRPLPNTGTCLHYKKSHRWPGNTDIDVNTDIKSDIDLNTDTDTNDCCRFPCCGKAFPCDVCHDSTEDHPMERANRMICGYCSKEQVHIHTYIHFILLMNKFCLMLMI